MIAKISWMLWNDFNWIFFSLSAENLHSDGIENAMNYKERRMKDHQISTQSLSLCCAYLNEEELAICELNFT